MADIHENDHDDHHDEHLNMSMLNATSIDVNSPEWIAIRVCLALTMIIEVVLSAVIIDILHRRKLISESILRIIGSLTSGLMLSGGLVHIYAEAIEHFVESIEEPEFFLPFLIGAVTILCLIIIDKIIHIGMNERKRYVARTTGNVMVKANPVHTGELELKKETEVEVEFKEGEGGEECKAKHGHSHFDIALGTEKWYVVIIFLIALSIHSVFEGLGFGTSRTLAIMFQIYVFIILHKGMVTASLCIVMLKNSHIFTRIRYYFVVIIFAIASPIGAFVGIGISNINTEFELVEVIFNSITAGTFLYLSIRELIPMFFDETEEKWWIDAIKIIAFVIGFGFLTGIAIWHPHEEH